MKRGDTVIIEGINGRSGWSRNQTIVSIGKSWITTDDKRRFYATPSKNGSHRQEDSSYAVLWPDVATLEADKGRRARLDWAGNARRLLALRANGYSGNTFTFAQLKAINAVVDLGAGEVPS